MHHNTKKTDSNFIAVLCNRLSRINIFVRYTFFVVIALFTMLTLMNAFFFWDHNYYTKEYQVDTPNLQGVITESYNAEYGFEYTFVGQAFHIDQSLVSTYVFWTEENRQHIGDCRWDIVNNEVVTLDCEFPGPGYNPGSYSSNTYYFGSIVYKPLSDTYNEAPNIIRITDPGDNMYQEIMVVEKQKFK